VDEATRQEHPAVDHGSREPEEIRRDIEETRSEVGDTAAALAEKADVKAQAKQKVDEVKERVGVGQAASTVSEKARRRPVPLAVAGAALAGFLLGRLTKRG
jgi:nucleotide-binding universal stress UspA family protein